MITVVHHHADRVIVDAVRVLRDFSAAGLLADIAVVVVGDAAWSGQPQAVCVRAGEDTETGLFDALATDPATDGHVLTAVASACLAPQAQRELAGAARRIADQGMRLAAVPVVASCLFVPESREGDSILPESGFFSESTANFVALPTDWRFVDGGAVPIEFADAERAAWHAALEIAALTSGWGAMANSRWHPEFLAPGVQGHALRFVRSSARLVTVSRSGPAAPVENVLPAPEGFAPAPVPELVGHTVAVLHPEVFRLDSRLGAAGGAGKRGGVLRLIVGALGGLFPPLAAGLRGFWRLLCTEVAKALSGDAGPGESDQPPGLQADRQAPDAAIVILEGFEPKVWTDLVRNVLGVADGGGAFDAAEARRVAGHKQFVFVTKDSLVDDVLERRTRTGFPDDAPVVSGGADSTDGGDDATEGEEELLARDSDSPDRAGGPVATTGRSLGLLTLMDDAFRREIAKARDRRKAQQGELEHLLEQVERTEKFEPPAALRTTIVAFFVTAFVVLASYVLLLDAFDLGGMDKPFRALLAIAATALTWLVLLYPLAPRGDDNPRSTQSYLLRSAALVAVLAALAAVFSVPISDFASSGGPWLELVSLAPAAVTLWLAWRVGSSVSARQRPAGRAVALAWTVCYLVVGLLLYANMGSDPAQVGDDVDRSVFNRWGWLHRFFETYGDKFRYAAIAVAGFLFLLALAMLAISGAGADRRHRRARARIRELRWELDREELLPMLKGLRVNWLGTAAALDHILRRAFPAPVAPGGAGGGLRSPLLRLAGRSREARHPPPMPGWLFAQYETAVDAYSARRDGRAGGARWVRPETATMVSRLDGDLLAAPGSDPRWDFAHRLGAGEFDDELAASSPGAGDGSLLDEDVKFLGEIAPVAPATLPLGLVGHGAASLGHVAMNGTWWWPDGFAPPESLTPPRPAETTRSPAAQAYLAVRLDISDPVLERQIIEGPPAPPAPDDEPPLADPGDELR